VDVAGWREAAHVSGPVDAASRLHETLVRLVEHEELLVLEALDHAEDAPGEVVVNGRRLPRTPDESEDREGTVRLRVEHVAHVAFLIPGPLLLGEDVRRRKMALELGGNETSGLGPGGARADGGSDSGNELF
jgi:hypothetical protein